MCSKPVPGRKPDAIASFDAGVRVGLDGEITD
jgi:hypothetical protein